ncbi:hypothetical protein GQ44DRAFT_768427 [Phaeosphaeriaceae sp. PMI808]|nr:hypothetical protein GQ44DRAFT_768427 [Phaeosphaeriaceae sp. PMI808]
MHTTSLFAVFGLLSSLSSGVVALGTLYRCDQRTPAVIKAGGGFTSKGADTANQANLFKHVDGWNYPNDPFISTSDYFDCQPFGRYRFTIDSSKITHKIWDVNEEYKKAGKKNGKEAEEEQSVERFIPWSAVIAVHQWTGEFFEPMAMPAKRSAFALDARRARIEFEG